MINIKCPNKNLPEWKELVDAVGENNAYYLWDQNNGYSLDKAPNGEPSKLFSDLLSYYNGDRNAAIQTKAKVYSEAFKNWFGDWLSHNKTNVSKVVDENGEPLMVYHGTNATFSDFNYKDEREYNPGFFFTSDKKYAESIAQMRGGDTIMPVYLNIKNPVVTDSEIVSKEVEGIFILEGNRSSDGIIGHDLYTGEFDRSTGTEYVVLKSTQIKSVDNQGTFSTQDNNIYLNQSNEPDIKDLLLERCKGLIHKYGANKDLYLTKTKRYDRINQRSIPKDLAELTRTFNSANAQANQLGFELVPSVRGDLKKRLLLRPLNLIDWISQSDTQDMDLEVQEVLNFLSDRFRGLVVHIVPADTVEDGVNAWIDGNEIYLVEGRYNKEIAIEEAIHPFINTLFNTNRELFDSLYSEISINYPKLKAQIERRYSNKDADTRKQELVAQAFSRAFNKEFSNNKPSKLRQVLYQFIEWLRNLFTTDVVSTYGDINYISTAELPKMTLSELVRIVHTNDTFFDVMFEGKFNSLNERQSEQVNKTYNRIQQGLKDRLKSVKRYSTKNPKLWNQLQQLITQLANSEAEQGMLQFLQHISDSIGEAIKFLQRPIDEINAKQIRQLSQDYVGFYKPLLDDILYLIDTTDIFKDLPNYADIQGGAQALATQMNQVYNRFNNILKSKGISELIQYLQQNGTPQEYIDRIINWLDNPNTDSNIFINWFGMASNSSNEIIQVIAKMLNDTMNQTQREVFEKGIRLVDLANKAKSKYGIDVQKLLYEKGKDGKYTGYIVRPINYGQYLKDKKEYLDKLANKLGITKDKEGRYQLPKDENALKKWYEGINKFYAERVNRRYTPEYYDLRNKYLSQKTRDAIDEIQNYIDAIIDGITIDGVQYDNLLTVSEYNQLQQLRKQRKLLANPYNLDGSLKTGDDAIIAKELTKFNEAVSGKITYTPDTKRYEKDRRAVEKKYGKDSNAYKLWVARNTETRWNQAFYDRLNALEREQQSQLYNDLVEKRRQLLSLFKDPKTGIPDTTQMSDRERAMLLQLDKDIDAARTLTEPNPNRTDSFNRFAEIVPTQQYYDDMKRARDAGEQAYNEWFWANHYEDQTGQVREASYYTTLKPKDEVIDQYSETVPTGRYATIDSSSQYFNPEYDTTGPSIQPKKKYYDNSRAYNEIMSKPELKELYEALQDTMREANSFISFLGGAVDGRMPQIPARFMQVMARQDGLLNRLKYMTDEIITTQPDDLDYVEEFSMMPNGDPIKVIPTRFIKMLEDPNNISTDATAAVIAYYSMASNFKNMQNQQDQVELMLNLLRTATIHNRKGVKTPGSSNLYKQAQLLVDRLMYGRNMSPLNINLFGKELNLGKTLNIVLEFIRKVNLSGNIWSIATSFFTDSTYTTLEAKLGRFFDLEDLQFAIGEYARNLPEIIANIGNPVPHNKLMYLMQLNQVVKENQEIFSRLDQSQVLRSINQNFWYAGYTQSDYLVKSHTLLSVYHNYRFVKDRGFMSKSEFINEFYPNNKKEGAAAFKQLKITLYDAYVEQSDGSTTIDDRYKEYITTQLLNKVKNRIDTLSRRIDGTLRDVDKAQVHANSIAQYIVMHKNFMIQGVHDRFKKRQFNLDTGVEEEGYYRSFARFLQNVIGNRHFSIAQLLADYNQLKDYEQYAIRRVLYEMVLITASTSLALAIASLVDGDDDYDNWVTQSITYLALRSAFEFRTMYNPFEFLALIKSPTAAFTWFDNASAFINLFNPLSYFGNGGPFEIIDRGVYKGMPRILRNVIKVTPARSIIEAADPESKRNYLQNQLMNF